PQEALFRPGVVGRRFACAAYSSTPLRKLPTCLARTKNDAPEEPRQTVQARADFWPLPSRRPCGEFMKNR
ncbi:MAG: hypothetical protein ACYC9Y_16535, partial [Candidatus Methylomirabilia bacterium]